MNSNEQGFPKAYTQCDCNLCLPKHHRTMPPPAPAPSSKRPSLRRRTHPIRHLRLHLRNQPQQILHDFIPRPASSLLDRLQLLLGIFARVFFGFFVAARMLLFVPRSVLLIEKGKVGGGWGKNLLLEFFEFVVFLFAVVFYFFLGFVFGVFYALGAVCGLVGWLELSGERGGGLGWERREGEGCVHSRAVRCQCLRLASRRRKGRQAPFWTIF